MPLNTSTDYVGRTLIALRELLTNKKTNFSLIDDIGYPTTKAVSDKIALLPGAIWQFIIVGSVTYTRYLYAWRSETSTTPLPSGDATSGFQFSNSSPIQAPFTGVISFVNIAVAGAAFNGAVTPGIYFVRCELFEVGFQVEGISKGFIDFPIDSNLYPVGSYYNVSTLTNYIGRINTNISIQEGKIYGLKFINVVAPGFIVSVKNISISMELKKS